MIKEKRFPTIMDKLRERGLVTELSQEENDALGDHISKIAEEARRDTSRKAVQSRRDVQNGPILKKAA